jgi:putative ABC transport system ATP-binding protein
MANDAQERILEVRGVTKDYFLGKTVIHALRGVDFSVTAGDFVSIVGPSGCGKTTLLNIIGCIDKPSSGSVHIAGEDVSTFDDNREADTRLSHIGFIFQSFNLVGVLDVRENIEFPLILAKVPAAERARRVDRLVDLVGLGDFVAHRPDELSGGQRQRVAIARALVNRPALILADEPTGNLDSRTGADVMRLFDELHQAGQTLVVVTHDADIAAHAERRVVFHDGTIVADEPTGRALPAHSNAASDATDRRTAT